MKILYFDVRGKIVINRVNWLLKDIFNTLIWYVIWLGVEIKEGKLNCGCCVSMKRLANLDRFVSRLSERI
jgi:hypothetical protein